MESIWKSRTLGRCLTEYTRRDFSDIVSGYTKFVTISQFSDTPKHIDNLNFQKSYDFPRQSTEPKLGYGQILFGVEEDGTLTKLKSIIDSSD